MQQPVVIIGLGELGNVFARGFLRRGHPVYPITRGMDLREAAAAIPAPQLALLAVAEKDLHAGLEQLPAAWRDRVCLLQNELLPRDWRSHAIIDPTVISAWFEKKKGVEPKVLLPSPAFGPHAAALCAALDAVNVPARILTSADDLLFELVRKNVYILTINIAGLVTGGTVSELWRDHESFARAVAADVIDIQDWLTDTQLPRDRLLEGLLEAFTGDPEHLCLGRTALPRLQRALSHADEARLAVPTLREIYAGREKK